MLSIYTISNSKQSREYLINLAQEDYYLDGGEPPGQWYGTAATHFGLAGQVERDSFMRLLQGYSPDGHNKLVRNAGDAKRTIGFDCTFSAPKSVSVLWSQADKGLREDVQAIHDQAVAKSLDWLESQMTTRRGAGGKHHLPAKMLLARFNHGTTREGDPQLHTHCVAFNIAVAEDDKTSTLDGRQLYINKMTAGALYRAELAKQLQQQLGLNLRLTQNRSGRTDGFEIAGISEDILQEFSKRAAQIRAHMAEHGGSSAVSAAIAALETRRVKEDIPPRRELFTAWQAIGHTLGYETPATTYNDGRPLLQRQQVIREKAVKTLHDHTSTFTANQLLCNFALAAPGQGLGVDALLELRDQTLASNRVVLAGWHKGAQYTTPEMQAIEQRILALAKAAQYDRSHPVSTLKLNAVIKQYPTLRPDQAQALHHIVDSQGLIKLMTGYAGVGKSFVMRLARQVWQIEGYSVMGLAPSGKAAASLEEGSGIASQTIHSFLHDKQKVGSLSKRSVVVCDEAALADTKLLDRLLQTVLTQKAKLVLLGDDKQLSPVGPGGCFKDLMTSLNAATLTEITRQTADWEKIAIKQLADGMALDALNAYDAANQLTIAPTRTASRLSLIEDWQQAGLAAPQDHVIYTGNNAAAWQLNQLAQEKRQAAGCLGDTALTIERPGWRGLETQQVYTGDRVVFLKNDRSANVVNGDVGTIETVAGETLHIRLDRNGQSRLIDTQKYPHLALGYALTTYKGQGDTVATAYCILDEGMVYQEHGYTQISRGRTTRIYAAEVDAGENRQQLIALLQQSRAKYTAHSLKRQPQLTQ